MKMRVTMTYEYDANEAHYDVVADTVEERARAIAKIDRDNISDDPALMMESYEVDVTVEPVGL